SKTLRGTSVVARCPRPAPSATEQISARKPTTPSQTLPLSPRLSLAIALPVMLRPSSCDRRARATLALADFPLPRRAPGSSPDRDGTTIDESVRLRWSVVRPAPRAAAGVRLPRGSGKRGSFERVRRSAHLDYSGQDSGRLWGYLGP